MVIVNCIGETVNN